MMVLCSNHSSKAFIAYARQHPDSVGWIMGPSAWKVPRRDIPYVLDNDAFIAWKNQTPWDVTAWRKMLYRVQCADYHRPRWILCPDVVANRVATIDCWHRYSVEVSALKIPVAFAVQDGMSTRDVPPGADVVFVGGSTEWKWKTARMWCESFPRVHIGRVRTGKLELAEEMGAESVDGSGFMRETFNGRPAKLLRAFIEGYRNTTPFFNFPPSIALDSPSVVSSKHAAGGGIIVDREPPIG